ncbi:UNVERIFIED_CONTAM: riboflavin kinase [Kocuria sp. CPCC 205316]|uniref:riboflavin kinase n=1 Tax=Kocuria TaxID=57493 RepID=UPI0036D975C2
MKNPHTAAPSAVPSHPADPPPVPDARASTSSPDPCPHSPQGVLELSRCRAVVWQVEGTVVTGDRRGRLLGFPTANVAVPDQPWRDGVWAATVQIDPARSGPVHLAAVSVGRRPTYYGRDGVRLLEAHLLDFAGDLYGHTVLVRLHERLRPQRRYSASKELVEQLHRDVAGARAWASREDVARTPDASPGARGHGTAGGGRRRPVRKKRRLSPEDVQHLQERRHRKREQLIGATVLDLSRQGQPPTHDLVARRTGLPLAFLRSRYPTAEMLAETVARAG